MKDFLDTVFNALQRSVSLNGNEIVINPPFTVDVDDPTLRRIRDLTLGLMPEPAQTVVSVITGGGPYKIQGAFGGSAKQGVLKATLPDEVKDLVTPASDFMEGVEVYKMSRIPRGKCIIINNKDFESDTTRLGSEVDVERMEKLFRALHFYVDVGSNMTAKEMKEMLSVAAMSQRNESYDALVVIIMSHGKSGNIQGSDGDYLHLMNDVYSKFNNKNCPGLKGKPKVFFVQACRGDEHDNGTPPCHDCADTSPRDENSTEMSAFRPPSDQHIPSWSDMFFAYGTIPGHLAYRERESGSWFISSLFDVFCENACKKDLQDMMRLVEKQVGERVLDDGSKQTATSSTMSWTKKLYFNPGLYKE